MDNSVSDYERKYKVYYGRRRAGNPLAVSEKEPKIKELEELLVEKENQVTELVEMIRRELEEKNARIRQLEEELEAEHKKNELLRSIQERLQKIEQSVNGTPLKSPATEEKESGLFAWQKKK